MGCRCRHRALRSDAFWSHMQSQKGFGMAGPKRGTIVPFFPSRSLPGPPWKMFVAGGEIILHDRRNDDPQSDSTDPPLTGSGVMGFRPSWAFWHSRRNAATAADHQTCRHDRKTLPCCPWHYSNLCDTTLSGDYARMLSKREEILFRSGPRRQPASDRVSGGQSSARRRTQPGKKFGRDPELPGPGADGDTR